MIYVFAIAVILSAVVMAVMEKHFITLGVFALLWGITLLIINSVLVVTFAVGVVFIIFETVRRKLHMVNLKM
ncbi:MAG: hypothetical protein E3J72_16130 [Planctomycetota bacterium]|nr:MAG: hypothetical protein E3J72_16130 [Planctomycetota bacterium]